MSSASIWRLAFGPPLPCASVFFTFNEDENCGDRNNNDDDDENDEKEDDEGTAAVERMSSAAILKLILRMSDIVND